MKHAWTHPAFVFVLYAVTLGLWLVRLYILTPYQATWSLPEGVSNVLVKIVFFGIPALVVMDWRRWGRMIPSLRLGFAALA